MLLKTKVLTVEEKVEKHKIACQNFLDKCKRKEEALTKKQLEEINKQRLENKRLYNAKFRERIEPNTIYR